MTQYNGATKDATYEFEGMTYDGIFFTSQEAGGAVTSSSEPTISVRTSHGGSSTPSSDIDKLASVLKFGSTSPSSALLKSIAGAIKSGVVDLSGTSLRSLSKSLHGASTLYGLIKKTAKDNYTNQGMIFSSSNRKVSVFTSHEGSQNHAGALRASLSRSHSGVVSSITGALNRAPRKPLAGLVGPQGNRSKLVGKISGGIVDPTKGFAKLVAVSYEGVSILAGTITKQLKKFFGAVITTIGEAVQRYLSNPSVIYHTSEVNLDYEVTVERSFTVEVDNCTEAVHGEG